MPDSPEKKLFVVHVGFYDEQSGIYESHTNFFVAAADAREAKQIVKAMPVYKAKKMHTDGIQEIGAVSGFRIRLERDAALDGKDIMHNYSYETLNPAA